MIWEQFGLSVVSWFSGGAMMWFCYEMGGRHSSHQTRNMWDIAWTGAQCAALSVTFGVIPLIFAIMPIDEMCSRPQQAGSILDHLLSQPNLSRILGFASVL